MTLPVCKFSFKLVDWVFLSTLSQLQLLSLFLAELIGLCQLNRILVINWDFIEHPESTDIVLNIRTVYEVQMAEAAQLSYLTSQIALNHWTKVWRIMFSPQLWSIIFQGIDNNILKCSMQRTARHDFGNGLLQISSTLENNSGLSKKLICLSKIYIIMWPLYFPDSLIYADRAYYIASPIQQYMETIGKCMQRPGKYIRVPLWHFFPISFGEEENDRQRFLPEGKWSPGSISVKGKFHSLELLQLRLP